MLPGVTFCLRMMISLCYLHRKVSTTWYRFLGHSECRPPRKVWLTDELLYYITATKTWAIMWQKVVRTVNTLAGKQ
jgi:hypothetical protein